MLQTHSTRYARVCKLSRAAHRAWRPLDLHSRRAADEDSLTIVNCGGPPATAHTPPRMCKPVASTPALNHDTAQTIQPLTVELRHRRTHFLMPTLACVPDAADATPRLTVERLNMEMHHKEHASCIVVAPASHSVLQLAPSFPLPHVKRWRWLQSEAARAGERTAAPPAACTHSLLASQAQWARQGKQSGHSTIELHTKRSCGRDGARCVQAFACAEMMGTRKSSATSFVSCSCLQSWCITADS